MSGVTTTTNGGGTLTLDPQMLDGLRARLRGTLALPGDAGYDAARAIWNGMIDRRPAAIVRAAGAGDVLATIAFARDHDLVLAVRGGGHNIAGNAVCEGGLMLDLSPMKSVRVDPVAKTARVEPGVTLGEFDRECQAFGLATPTGINSTTGIAGLTLGGGFGWLSRKYGLTVDNLLAADVVTADGKLVHASEQSNPDLFWAIRGGGGNFGVVASFEYRLHPLGPEILAGLLVHPFANARTIFDEYKKITAAAPEELTVWIVMRKAPPLPFVPAEWHGKEVMVVAFCWAGDPAKGKGAAEKLQAIGKPVGQMVAPMPLVAWQSAFDPLLTPGVRNYWKSHDFKQIDDGLVATFVEFIGRLPGPDCEIFVGHLGGAINKIPASATAYPHRDINYVMNVHTRWSDAAQDKPCIAWARELFDKTGAFATGGVYVNFMPEDETGRVKAGAYGPNFERLAKLKAKYDPKNLFRMNQNIKPGT